MSSRHASSLAILVLAATLCPRLPAQPPKTDPPALTPAQVIAAWNAVNSHGCLVSGYIPDVYIAPAKATAPIRDLPGSPAMRGYSGERVYALSFPASTGDSDLLRLAPSLARLPFLRTLDLGRCKVGDEGMKALKGIPELEAVFLDHTSVGDAGVKLLAECPHLRWVNLTQTKVTDAGLAHLASLKSLQVLSLAENPKVTDAGLPHLMGLTKLTSLNLAGTQVSMVSPPNLASLKVLSRLDLARSAVRDDTLKSLAALPALTELNLSGTTINGSGLAPLASLKSLRVLRLDGAAVTDEGATGIAALKGIRQLELSNPIPPEPPMGTAKPATPERPIKLTDAGLASIGKCVCLRKLALARTNVTGTGLKQLAPLVDLGELDLEGSALVDDLIGEIDGIKGLRSLSLARTAFKGTHLRSVANLPLLRELDLQFTGISDEKIGTLGIARQLQNLNLRGTNITNAGIGSLTGCPLNSLDVSKTKVGVGLAKVLVPFAALRVVTLDEVRATDGTAAQFKPLLPNCVVIVADKPAPHTNPPAVLPPRFPLD